jgi:hypothetical protein
MGGGEQGAQGGPLKVAADRWALRPSGVHDRQNILHGVLKDYRSGRVIGKTGTALVEHDQPGERHQPRIPAHHTRPLVVLLQMRGERWNQDQIQGSIPEHAISDVDTAAVDIPNLGTSHRATTNAATLRTYQLHRVAWMAGCLSSGEVAMPVVGSARRVL